jgi:PPK2 family polyphosphate:nucleotide phosphotransferase
MDVSRFRVAPGHAIDLRDVDPRATPGFDGGKAAARAQAATLIARLGELQGLLYADGRHRVLVVLQAMDAGGKDGTIRAVFDGVNPQGTTVSSFGRPSEEELAHDYLWRVHAHVPRSGELAIFNRSHYEDVLVVRVHDLVPEERWQRRYGHIADFERMLADEGTTIVKLFLHISADEQRERLQERLDDPAKAWKFDHNDLEQRAHWEDYRRAFEEVLARTSTPWAPWYVVPADRNWFRNLVVSSILVETLEGLDLRYPSPQPGLEGLKVT